MNSSEPINEVSIMKLCSKWKGIREKYEKYISEAPVRGYGPEAAENQMILIDEFEDAVKGTYDVFCGSVVLKEISKSLLLLFNEVKAFALNNNIKTYADGFLEIRTGIAAALCDILIENMDYGDTHRLIFYLSDTCQAHKEGYYVLEVQDFTFSYICKKMDFGK